MKQIQRQQLQQKLSPQQIQLMRLLQLPVTELESAIKEEIEKNPLLEATPVESPDNLDTPEEDNNASDWDSDEDDFGYDYHEHLESDPNSMRREFIVADSQSFYERMASQLASRQLSDRQQAIATEIIGSIDDAGYLSRDMALITNDLAFRQGIDASNEEVEEVLHTIQSLDPAGIGARNLQECLMLQLQRMAAHERNPEVDTALQVIEHHFDDFANHRYDRIVANLGISQEQFDRATDVILHLNPKPGGSDNESRTEAVTVTPDIILQQQDGELSFYLNDYNIPRLSLNEYYIQMLHDMEQQKGDKQTIQFLRTKQADAQGFIDLLQQRHNTIVRVMKYIVRHQRQYLLTGNPNLMVPLRQREVAEATGLDISTVSRMANSKYIQTTFGTIALKDCFSKGLADNEGNEISVDSIKNRLADLINSEDKHAPLSDDALAKQLNGQGMPVARRTVAKYREQLGFPVARLRRIIILLLFLASGAAQGQMSYYDSILNARLTAAESEAKTKAATVKATAERKTAPTPKAEEKKQEKPQPPTPGGPVEERAAMTRAMVPMWYDGFPQNRVNPMGRTQTDMLPDEINIHLITDTSEFCFPVKNAKTSNYGWRWHRGHHGVDIRLNTGDPVHCAFSGIVRVAARMGGYGNCVVVRHPNGLETLYGHLSQIKVKPYQEVQAGDIIGLGGSTGNSTGPHLHFEVRFLYQTFDPEWLLDFNSFSLRTRRLHLDKSYFGIYQPRKGTQTEYKADGSIIKESKKNRKSQNQALNPKDF